MFALLEEKVGAAGLIVAIVALVTALSGGAFAAQKFITKKEAIKIAKKYAGKNGAAGAQGPAGPAGATGAKGENGATGQQGETGETGETGPAGPVETTLPAGKTMTGVWGFRESNVTEAYAQISFPLRYPGEPEFHVLNEGEASTTECPGSASNPQAQAGHLCIYVAGTPQNIQFCCLTTEDDQFHSGLLLKFPLEDPTEEAYAHGTWAAAK